MHSVLTRAQGSHIDPFFVLHLYSSSKLSMPASSVDSETLKKIALAEPLFRQLCEDRGKHRSSLKLAKRRRKSPSRFRRPYTKVNSGNN